MVVGGSLTGVVGADPGGAARRLADLDRVRRPRRDLSTGVRLWLSTMPSSSPGGSSRLATLTVATRAAICFVPASMAPTVSGDQFRSVPVLDLPTVETAVRWSARRKRPPGLESLIGAPRSLIARVYEKPAHCQPTGPRSSGGRAPRGGSPPVSRWIATSTRSIRRLGAGQPPTSFQPSRWHRGRHVDTDEHRTCEAEVSRVSR